LILAAFILAIIANSLFKQNLFFLQNMTIGIHQGSPIKDMTHQLNVKLHENQSVIL
jgi:hypothetical protein